MRLTELLWVIKSTQQIWVQRSDGEYIYCGAAGDILWRIAKMCTVMAICIRAEDHLVLEITVEEVRT